MAEEVEQESTGKSFKNIIIGLVSTVTLGIGGFITNKLTGGGDDETQAAPVINITNSNQQSQAAGGKTVIIKEKSGEPAKPAAPVKKKDGDEFKEKPAEW
jgi:outer membrane scaffolding protein for murein synthesis (MipA/OmpV family)